MMRPDALAEARAGTNAAAGHGDAAEAAAAREHADPSEPAGAQTGRRFRRRPERSRPRPREGEIASPRTSNPGSYRPNEIWRCPIEQRRR